MFGGGIGTGELLIIFLVILLLFGSKRIPDVAKGLGKGITEFKRALRSAQEEIELDLEHSETVSPRSGKDPAQTDPDAGASGPGEKTGKAV